MLDKIVTFYRKTEMNIISGFSGIDESIIEETSFYDVGYIQSQISRIQKELQSITNELQTAVELNSMSNPDKKRGAELLEQRERLLFCMIYLASNSFGNLDDCIKLADGHSFSFMRCVQALKEYRYGSKEKAFQELEAYYKEYGSVEEHFLVNKVFGLLLVEKQIYKQAVSFLTYALQYVPDDSQCLEALSVCYKKQGKEDRANVVDEVLALLA